MNYPHKWKKINLAVLAIRPLMVPHDLKCTMDWLAGVWFFKAILSQRMEIVLLRTSGFSTNLFLTKYNTSLPSSPYPLCPYSFCVG